MLAMRRFDVKHLLFALRYVAGADQRACGDGIATACCQACTHGGWPFGGSAPKILLFPEKFLSNV